MEQKDNQTEASKKDGRPIGGWLWVIMIVIIGSGLQILIGLSTSIKELISDEWNLYFQTDDETLQTRINIYVYLIAYSAIGIGFLVWTLIVFFKRKKQFPAVFLGVLGYFMLTEILRIYLMDYYFNMIGQDASNIETGLAKTGIAAIISGLYLNKGKRPIQTFIK